VLPGHAIVLSTSSSWMRRQIEAWGAGENAAPPATPRGGGGAAAAAADAHHPMITLYVRPGQEEAARRLLRFIYEGPASMPDAAAAAAPGGAGQATQALLVDMLALSYTYRVPRCGLGRALAGVVDWMGGRRDAPARAQQPAAGGREVILTGAPGGSRSSSGAPCSTPHAPTAAAPRSPHPPPPRSCGAACLSRLLAVPLPSLAWATVSQVLRLPHAQLAARDAKPLVAACLDRLQGDFGDLEAVAAAPPLLARFAALPFQAVLQLLLDERTAAASENTALVLAHAWLAAQPPGAGAGGRRVGRGRRGGRRHRGGGGAGAGPALPRHAP
jgi:hypothetical protein